MGVGFCDDLAELALNEFRKRGLCVCVCVPLHTTTCVKDHSGQMMVVGVVSDPRG